MVVLTTTTTIYLVRAIALEQVVSDLEAYVLPLLLGVRFSLPGSRLLGRGARRLLIINHIHHTLEHDAAAVDRCTCLRRVHSRPFATPAINAGRPG